MDQSARTPLRLARSHTSEPAVGVEIYRPFFIAGIITVLTAGCLLGALALAAIAKERSYTASSWAPYILAHANAQLFGWVGFFVMGFALQHHSPALSKARLFHLLAWASLATMVAGIASRFAAELFVAAGNPLGASMGVISGVMQAIAVALFLFNTAYTRRKTKEKLRWPTMFVFSSLGWLAAIAAAEPIFFLATHQPSRVENIQFLAEWSPIIRDAQFLGFVAMMIFGVSLSKFSTCFAARPAVARFGIAGYGLWMVGLFLRMFGWHWYFRNDLEPSASISHYLGGVCLLAGATLIALSSNVFSHFEHRLRAHKFIRAAFFWLLIGTSMMVYEVWHIQAIGQPFSHAFSGAIRHALTVGFISQMIVGVGSHVVARMHDLDDNLEPQLLPTYLLLNLGNASRVALEVATDYNGNAFPLMGVTGFIEVMGLVLWAIVMVRTLRQGSSLSATNSPKPRMPYAS